MAKLVASSDISNNKGEKFFIDKAVEYLDDNIVIYWNKIVLGREFDVCILVPDVGIIIVEVKGWNEDTIKDIKNSDTFIIKTNSGDEEQRPQKQCRGYRFAMSNLIRQSLKITPRICSMVAFPRITEEAYNRRRMDVVTERLTTFLKEDFSSKVSFQKKINDAFANSVSANCNFSRKEMSMVRQMFEADFAEDIDYTESKDTDHHRVHYSHFFYFDNNTNFDVDKLCNEYLRGTKIYAVFADRVNMEAAIAAIGEGLTSKGIVRKRNDLLIDYSGDLSMPNEIDKKASTFSAFNCSFSLLSDINNTIESFDVIDGRIDEQIEARLGVLSQNSGFNLEQYLIEHAPYDKNILVKAGAGTGKTYTMISRLAYLCYALNLSLALLAEKILMITFTNEAANLMKERLKSYFKNYYILTGDSEYLDVISRIDYMNISTIDSYAKSVISDIGADEGYGHDISVTSSMYRYKRKIAEILDTYIANQQKQYGDSYIDSLGIPMYSLKNTVNDFISKLHNKSIDVGEITSDSFGSVVSGSQSLHVLLADVIPQVEKEIGNELLENNQIHLNSIISTLDKLISDENGISRLQKLSDGKIKFMYVDEFQDTDDIQIEILMKIARIQNYRMFVVGDIKQCIYRFRGAQEKAFDKLDISTNQHGWLDYSLNKNYRTDVKLLQLFDNSFSAWGRGAAPLLAYNSREDRLIGMKHYNDGIPDNKFYKRLQSGDQNKLYDVLFDEVARLQRRIKYEEDCGRKLSKEEKTIAILVRENWQAEEVKKAGKARNVDVYTAKGGNLYSSVPAIDMMTLINALVHYDEAEYLYALTESNFFSLAIPKKKMLELRNQISRGVKRDKAKYEENEIANYLIKCMNKRIVESVTEINTWENAVRGLRCKPVLQVVRELYAALKPWENYSSNLRDQQYYSQNVDVLFEQIIRGCNTDSISITALRDFLFNNIVSKTSVDTRTPSSNDDSKKVECVTVHKSKGLEYGHVIIPFASWDISQVKESQLNVTIDRSDDGIKIGYSFKADTMDKALFNEYYDKAEEQSDKTREETRILYVAMTRSICSFSLIEVKTQNKETWQSMVWKEEMTNAV